MSSVSETSLNEFPASYYESPNLHEFFERLIISVQEFAFNSTKYPTDYDFTWRMLTSVQLVDVGAMFGVAVVLTLMRLFLTRIFSIPVGNWLKLLPKNRSKWPESVFKFLYYSSMWLWCLYIIVFSGRYDFLQKPLNIWKGWIFDANYLQRQIPSDIYWIYVVQLGFYIHSVFGTIFMDVWRKDSVVMLLHHGITIFLLEFSFLMKYYKIGALVLLIHDLSDVLLEFTKLNIYLKDRNGRNYMLNEMCANFGFLIFAISWAWLRLFWFPLKVLYTCHWGVYLYHKDKDPKMFVFFNSLLYALQILHIYWFYFVLLLLWRVAFGKMREVDDTRDFEESDGDSKRQHAD